ncbi:DUF3000 domain-containing protein [Rothia halotolerans]|uniref:DUF3000 domain-containing protein n=1 Tax=Rothia halotolerans TaxID=405770 RepID=UPI00101CEDCC|nr:DUF3000 domain-containing protein [Rothia halotolerans]
MSIEAARPETPRRFSEALDQLGHARLRPGLRLSSRQPSPARLAPHGVSFSAGVQDPHDADRPLATGRFILLHDPAGPEPWGGDLRVVTYLRAAVEPDVVSDELFSQVAWDWLLEALEGRGALHAHAAGTATRSFSHGFGSLSGGQQSTEIELRASWTPQGPDMRRHLEAWGDLVGVCAGLPPEPARSAPEPAGPAPQHDRPKPEPARPAPEHGRPFHEQGARPPAGDEGPARPRPVHGLN